MSSARWLTFVVFSGVMTAQVAHYDLGGPCASAFESTAYADTQKARKAGDWETVIATERGNVRKGCGIAYRWLNLADALVEGHPGERGAGCAGGNGGARI